ncbi:MAG: hypothetical protein WCZ12_01925 [Patescibacteria group bacterium]
MIEEKVETSCLRLGLGFNSEFVIISSEEGNKISFKKNDQENVLMKGFLGINSEDDENVTLNVRASDDILSMQLLIPFLREIVDEIEATGKKIIIKFNSIMEEILL